MRAPLELFSRLTASNFAIAPLLLSISSLHTVTNFTGRKLVLNQSCLFGYFYQRCPIMGHARVPMPLEDIL